jgi:hypothetical protein
MRRFYLHVKYGDEIFPDQEGIELPDIDAARSEALQTARELLGDAVRGGKPTVPDALVIADDAGQTLEIVPLAAVLPEPLKK